MRFKSFATFYTTTVCFCLIFIALLYPVLPSIIQQQLTCTVMFKLGFTVPMAAFAVFQVLKTLRLVFKSVCCMLFGSRDYYIPLASSTVNNKTIDDNESSVLLDAPYVLRPINMNTYSNNAPTSHGAKMRMMNELDYKVRENPGQFYAKALFSQKYMPSPPPPANSIYDQNVYNTLAGKSRLSYCENAYSSC